MSQTTRLCNRSTSEIMGLCKVRMRTADGGRRTADGQKKKKIIEKKNDMKNNKLIIEIVEQLMPFK